MYIYIPTDIIVVEIYISNIILYVLKIYPWEGKIIILAIYPAGFTNLTSTSQYHAASFLLNTS
jgi:hypothetical protein